MKFFLDTANPGEISRGIDGGIVGGVNTHPALILTDKGFDRFLRDFRKVFQSERTAAR